VSTPSEATVASRSAAADRPSAGSGIAIAVIAGAQLMVALGVTIVNIALPPIHGTAFAAGAGFAALALLVALVVVRVQAGEINPAHVH